ncbi:MAG: RsmB/NOP family class I SAM-dependent RNA methyltransferase [Clostridia bacterium]|nr:RsmB/NOP family class I SAM-dependent RNA methyltransferase [Clostridia bacterium]
MDQRAYLMEQMEKQYGGGDLERIRAGFSCRRRTSLRVNPLRSDLQRVREILEREGMHFETVPWYRDALVLEHGMEEQLQKLPVYEAGGIYLQSLSSMIPPLLLKPLAGENILDMAAAPGGKTTEIVALTGNAAMITACERNAGRAERLRFNLTKQGATRVTVLRQDARQLEEFYRFDRILLDAPCSGSGTVSPQFRGTFTEENLNKTTRLQREMLAKAIQMVSPGHEIVYSTCSILRAENENIVGGAVRSGKVQVIPIEPDAFAGVPRLPVSLPGTLCICPDEFYEGFFAARLLRI